MNSLGKILVHLDDSPSGEGRLALARQVALIRAKLTGLPSDIEAIYAVTPSYLSSTFAYSEYSGSTFNMLLEADVKRRDRAKAHFDQWTQTAGPAITWHDGSKEALASSFLNRSWLSDLLVLGQFNPAEGGINNVEKSFPSSLIIDSGKPALILPFIGSMKSTLQNVMIAWKSSKESSRALSAAIPFLQNAQKIHLVADIPQLESDEFMRRFELYLRANGITVKPSFQKSSGLNADGEMLLSRVADAGADLLVMGCYGHSRTREFVLGGTSRTILESMTLPTLMAH
jgi:nucleotide-binding universal stress UspA family protein